MIGTVNRLLASMITGTIPGSHFKGVSDYVHTVPLFTIVLCTHDTVLCMDLTE